MSSANPPRMRSGPDLNKLPLRTGRAADTGEDHEHHLFGIPAEEMEPYALSLVVGGALLLLLALGIGAMLAGS